MNFDRPKCLGDVARRYPVKRSFAVVVVVVVVDASVVVAVVISNDVIIGLTKTLSH